MPVGEEDHGGVAMAVATELPRGRDQSLDFDRGQMLSAAPLSIGLSERGRHRELSRKR